MILFDLGGLTNQPDKGKYANALGLSEYTPVEGRLGLLARLINGAGVTIITGPMGRMFWAVVSPEVKIRVMPDDYEFDERISLEEWAAIHAGVPADHARKNTGHKKYAAEWQLAEYGLACLDSEIAKWEPLIIEQFSSQVVAPEALDKLFAEEEFAALDWEWDEDTLEPLGLACSGISSNLYAPRATREQFRELLRSYPVVLHESRADLRTQFPGDPIEILGTPPHDTAVMAYLCGEPLTGLKVLTPKLLGREVTPYKRELTTDTVVAARYAAAGDTRNTYDLFRLLSQRLIETNQWEVYDKIDRRVIPIVASMEKYGTPVDMPAVLRRYREHVAITAGLRAAVLEHYGFDIRTRENVRALIKSQTGYDPGTTDKRLLSLNPAGYIDLILEHNAHKTRGNDFLKALIKRWVAAGRPDDFRVYPRFNQASKSDGSAAPKTGRFSSADPNMQNQPVELRDIYVPPPGYEFFAADYGAIELRVAAWLSQDREMLAGLSDGRDLHSEFREYIHQVTGKDVGRKSAKEGNFEQLFGGGADTLQKLLAKKRSFLSIEGCQAIVDAHASKFWVYHKWMAHIVAEARDKGYAETYFGRRLYLPDLNSPDSKVRSHAERQAVSHTVQGTAADLLKMAMHRVAEYLMDIGHICATVHDELAGWKHKAYDTEFFKQRIGEIMTSVAPPGLRLVVEVKVGRNWGMCK